MLKKGGKDRYVEKHPLPVSRTNSLYGTGLIQAKRL